MRSTVTISTITLMLGALPAIAQVPSALVIEGEALPGSPNAIISSIVQTAVNHQRGYAVLVSTVDGGATVSTIWGAPEDGPGMIVRTEGTIGNLRQESFEGFFGIGVPTDGNTLVSCYSASCTDTATGQGGLDSAWEGDTVAALEEASYPNEVDQYWSFASRPGALGDGTVTFVGGITSTSGGSTQRRGLFRGVNAAPVLVGGDMVPGIPVPIDASGIDFDYRFSREGTRYITPVVAGASAYMVLTGAALEIDGGVVAEGNPVPIAAGGLPGESWDNFDFTGVTEAGTYMFTGDTDAVTTLDEIVVVDGVIRYREGGVVDGEVLTGSIEGGYLNDEGDVALIWDVADSTGSLEALIVNDLVVIKEGDPVDMDGDGSPDPGTRLDNFTGISSLTLGDRLGFEDVQVFFTADVEVPLGAPRALATSAVSPGEEAGVDAADLEACSQPRGTQVIEAAFRVYVSVIGVAVPQHQGEGTIRSVSVTRNPVSIAATTALVVELARGQEIAIDVIGIDGRRIRRLESGTLGAGRHRIEWDHTDARGRRVSAGAYWLVVSGVDARQSVRLTVLD